MKCRAHRDRASAILEASANPTELGIPSENHAGRKISFHILGTTLHEMKSAGDIKTGQARNESQVLAIVGQKVKRFDFAHGKRSLGIGRVGSRNEGSFRKRSSPAGRQGSHRLHPKSRQGRNTVYEKRARWSGIGLIVADERKAREIPQKNRSRTKNDV
jgi:hypothetical protein